MTTWTITGCSTGLGRSLAEAVLAAGHNAVVTARDVAKVQDLAAAFPDTALAAPLDVTDKEQVARVAAQAQDHFGSVDVLVNNAGYRAAVEEGDDKEVEDLFATNFFGTVSMIKAVVPGMRSRRSGTIFNVSSIAGRLAAPGSGYCAASKNDKTHGRQPGDPRRAATALLELVGKSELPARFLLGSDAVKIVGNELDSQRREIDAWKELSVSSDFQSGERGRDEQAKGNENAEA
ncbi:MULTISPECIES: SDR family NAD(P)-dependent oxidoreductase [Rhizobium]|uniref:Oxidoreductase SSP0419 n=1 Tax=Rhizobium favelukesii TaxID=348824 RepID=W6RI20_9HYPH|nr:MULTISPECIES: SDR family NAD(P)-dependent oxidoreductase [Rhizobium]UFS85570.1 SDR family NAD(P)-dependent oxidoreductase [Rhizobium sp. T136]CDM60877.1 putative oxidoreductase SSP0419 [Rhizobium favelukesii]